MTQTIGDLVSGLRESMAGAVFTETDQGYDDARRVWNADIDRRPAVVAMCASPADVTAAVLFGAEAGLEIAVRGGAHSIWGASTVDGGLMINLADLNHIDVDPVARRARVGGGALLGELIDAAQEHGLATTVGAVGHTGVGGLTLGGGMGWLTRKHGLSIDNLVSLEVVIADGTIVRAAADENPDLFWALRGGGGNFGVVTEFEFELHPVGPMIQFGLLFWELADGKEVLRLARDVVGALPPEVNVIVAALNAPPAPFVPAEHHFTPGYAMLVAGFGSQDEFDGVIDRFHAGPAPLFEFTGPMPYAALQRFIDEANAWGQYYHDAGHYFTDLTDETIDTITEFVPKKNSPQSVMLAYRLDAAYSAVGDDATAFSGGRSPRYGYFIIGISATPDLLPAERAWVRGFRDALTSLEPSDGTYVNALDGDATDDRVRKAYGPEKYDRLAAVKATYDPTNLFRRNANIKPATAPPAQRSGH